MRNLQNKFKKATATPKGKIIALSIFMVILIAIAGAIVYWNIYRKQIIRNELQRTIRDKSKGLYKIHYDKLTLDEVGGNLSVLNVKLAYDSTRYIAFLEKE